MSEKKGNILFVCCADDTARENYIAENCSDMVAVPFTDSDYHLCSNILVMNPEYKRTFKDVLRSPSDMVVSTPIIDVNILDGLFLKRVLKGSRRCSAVVIFPQSDIPSEVLSKYRPPFVGNEFAEIRYVCQQAGDGYDFCNAKYERAVGLIGEYNDDDMLRLVNDCVFRVASVRNAGAAAYSVAPYLVNTRSACMKDVIFAQGIVYSLRLSRSRDSEIALQRIRDSIGVRAYNAFALLKIIYSEL